MRRSGSRSPGTEVAAAWTRGAGPVRAGAARTDMAAIPDRSASATSAVSARSRRPGVPTSGNTGSPRQRGGPPWSQGRDAPRKASRRATRPCLELPEREGRPLGGPFGEPQDQLAAAALPGLVRLPDVGVPVGARVVGEPAGARGDRLLDGVDVGRGVAGDGDRPRVAALEDAEALVAAEAELDRDGGARLERVERRTRLDRGLEAAERVRRAGRREVERRAVDVPVLEGAGAGGPHHPDPAARKDRDVVQRLVERRE